MVLHGHAFADVVQEQRQNQQIAAVRRLPQLPEVRAASIRRFGQLLQVLDGAQGVLVHRVAVIKIANHQRIDAGELRQDFRQQPQTLQRAQRHAWVIGTQDLSQRPPTHFRVLHRQFRMFHDVRDAALGAPAQRNSGSRRFGEKGKQDGAVGNLLGVEQFEPSVAHGERFPIPGLGPCRARYVEKPLAQSLWRRRFLLEITQQLPVQRARVPKIQPHPLRGIARQSIGYAKGALSGTGLQLVGQRIVVARVAVMEKAANGAEEIHGAGGQLFFRRAAAQGLALFAANLAQPHRSLVVAQTTGRILDVRFEMKNRVAVARESLLRQLMELRQQKRPRGFGPRRQTALVELFKEFRVTRQKPAVQQCQMKFRVILLDTLAFLHRAPGGAHAKTQVPQRAREVRDQRPELFLSLVAGKKEKDIEVGIRKQEFATVAAERQQGQSRSRRVVYTQHFAKNLPDVVIGQLT